MAGAAQIIDQSIIQENPLVLREGGILQGDFIHSCVCMQESFEVRKLRSIIAERLIADFYCTDESVANLRNTLNEHIADRGIDSRKAFNLARRGAVLSYGSSVAGGRASAADLNNYLTIRQVIRQNEQHGMQGRLMAVVLSDHDGCAAESQGTIISWQQALQYTYHDLHRSMVSDQVDIYAAWIKTVNSTVETIVHLGTYERADYMAHQVISKPINALIPVGVGQTADWSFEPLPEGVWTGNLYQQAAMRAVQ